MEKLSELMQHQMEEQEISGIAQSVYMWYIDDDAASMVNISYAMKIKISEMINSPGVKDEEWLQELYGILCEIKKEIFMLMFNDPFARFHYTKPYRLWRRRNVPLLSQNLEDAGSMIIDISLFKR